MRLLAASVLVAEAFVIFFATLVAKDLSDVESSTVWLVGGAGALAALVVAGLLRRPWGYLLGSLLQVLVIAAGLVVPVMFFLGAVFAALWGLAILLGRRVERLRAAAGAGAPDQ
ncbi:MAG: hypothetical protein QOJ90_1697 [Actinomycetota bacterium]|jgi:hypothetical protein|nr:hypothetical protein [Actinomycetota bacterium]